ncbi:MAG: DUF342 domain-containing protein [Lachnospiraceae bacterium]|nr:DUF342 domain-containing protein [Lachnospiraceae bacterium]
MAALTQEELQIAMESAVIYLEENGVKAYLNIFPPPKGKEYTVKDITWILKQKRVVFGVDTQAIKNMIANKEYRQQVHIATGFPREDGKDGYFEYYFDTVDESKPKVLEDGSVDYHTAGKVKVVEAGEVIARYFPPTKGKNGFSVAGEQLMAKPGKEQRTLRGRGFYLSEDKCVYTAAVTGKAVITGNVLNVKNILEIDGMIDYLLKDLVFDGDIIVRGDVMQGITIKATGSVTICGTVEPSTIEAGKDVILQSGMQGSGKGSIRSGGNVSGKFFEQVNIIAEGNVNANYILNCDIKCNGNVEVAGNKGAIIGGKIVAGDKIVASIIGNRNEAKTVLSLVDIDYIESQIEEAEETLNNDLKRVDELTLELRELAMAQSLGTVKEVKDSDRKKISEKIRLTNELSLLQQKLDRLRTLRLAGATASFSAKSKMYPGTVLIIEGSRFHCTTQMTFVTVKKIDGIMGALSCIV